MKKAHTGESGLKWEAKDSSKLIGNKDHALRGLSSPMAGIRQLLVILSVMNLIDRFLIDGYWVGHTNAWTIPGTEDLKPYITAKDKQKKWLFGTVGMAGIAAVLAVLMTAFIH